MVYRRASGVCRPDPSSSAADGWMDGWMPNQTMKPYCLHIHTNTSQCVPHARASHCGTNRTVYAYKHTHIHPSQCVPVCPARTRVPLWDKPYCLHIHTSAKQCVRPERRRRRRRHTHPPAGRATKASSTTVTTNRFGSSDDDDRTPTNDRDRRRVVVERTNERSIGTEKRTQRGGRRARLDWIRF